MQQFWDKVDKSGGPDACWPWIGGKEPRGYGYFDFRGKRFTAHRFAYIVHRSPGSSAGLLDYVIPDKVIRHTCDNPPCCNPYHLRAGTQKDNINDAVERGRNPRGETHGCRKLSKAIVEEIRRAHRFRIVTAQMLADRFGVHKETILRLLRKETWR